MHSLQDEEHWLRNEQNPRLKVAAAVGAGLSGRTDRYRTQRVRAVVRMCIGVLAALIGISLIGAACVSDLDATTAPALFAAVAFCLTQEPVTRILEDKASKATNKTDTASPGPSDDCDQAA